MFSAVAAVAEWRRATGRPLYGLDAAFTGRRWIADFETVRVDDRDGRGPQVLDRRVGLGHGNLALTARSGVPATLQVVNCDTAGPPLDWFIEHEIANLADDDPLRTAAIRARRAQEDIVVQIDGIAMRLPVQLRDEVWAARAEMEGHVLVLIGVRWARSDIAVVAIDDIQPYLDGRDALLRDARAG